jgi:hypothetical protein
VKAAFHQVESRALWRRLPADGLRRFDSGKNRRLGAAAEKLIYFVIPSEARNLSLVLGPTKE